MGASQKRGQSFTMATDDVTMVCEVIKHDSTFCHGWTPTLAQVHSQINFPEGFSRINDTGNGGSVLTCMENYVNLFNYSSLASELNASSWEGDFYGSQGEELFTVRRLKEIFI